jgi:hypothetical protein
MSSNLCRPAVPPPILGAQILAYCFVTPGYLLLCTSHNRTLTRQSPQTGATMAPINCRANSTGSECMNKGDTNDSKRVKIPRSLISGFIAALLFIVEL